MTLSRLEAAIIDGQKIEFIIAPTLCGGSLWSKKSHHNALCCAVNMIYVLYEGLDIEERSVTEERDVTNTKSWRRRLGMQPGGRKEDGGIDMKRTIKIVTFDYSYNTDIHQTFYSVAP
jgi:hypothetical protein